MQIHADFSPACHQQCPLHINDWTTAGSLIINGWNVTSHSRRCYECANSRYTLSHCLHSSVRLL